MDGLQFVALVIIQITIVGLQSDDIALFAKIRIYDAEELALRSDEYKIHQMRLNQIFLVRALIERFLLQQED